MMRLTGVFILRLCILFTPLFSFSPPQTEASTAWVRVACCLKANQRVRL